MKKFEKTVTGSIFESLIFMYHVTSDVRSGHDYLSKTVFRVFL